MASDELRDAVERSIQAKTFEWLDDLRGAVRDENRHLLSRPYYERMGPIDLLHAFSVLYQVPVHVRIKDGAKDGKDGSQVRAACEIHKRKNNGFLRPENQHVYLTSNYTLYFKPDRDDLVATMPAPRTSSTEGGAIGAGGQATAVLGSTTCDFSMVEATKA